MKTPQEEPEKKVIVDLGLLLPIGNRTYHVVACCDDHGSPNTFFVRDLEERVSCDFCEREHRVLPFEKALDEHVFDPGEGGVCFDAYALAAFMLRTLKQQAAHPTPKVLRGRFDPK